MLAYLPFTGRERAVTLGIEVFLGYEMVVGLLVLTQAWNREKELRRHNELMGSVIHSVTEGVVVAGTDGAILFVNEAARRLTGSRRSHGLRVAEWSGSYGLYQPETDRLFPPDQLPLVRALARRARRARPTCWCATRRLPAPAEAWASVTAAPIRTAAASCWAGSRCFATSPRRSMPRS